MSDPRVIRPHAEVLEPSRYPNTAERIVRSVMHVVAIVLMTLTALLVLSIVQTLGSIADGIERIQAPEPAQTECVGELC